MKMKMNNFIIVQKEQDDKIQRLQGMVDKLTSENVKIHSDMRILRDEHTEVLH